MSDHASHSYADYEGTSSKPTHPYQSMWMGHWVSTSGNAGITSQVDSDLSLRLETIEDAAVNTKKLHLPLKDELDPSSQGLTLSLTNFPETDHNYASASKFPSLPATSSTEKHLWQMNNSKVVDDSLALAIPYSDRFTKFIQGWPSTAEKGKMSSFMSRYKSKDHFSSTDLTILENTRSSIFICEEKIDNNPSKPGRSMFLHNPSSSKPDLPLFMGQQFQKIQNMSEAGSFSGQGRFQEEIRTETSFQCYDKVKTKKIFTTSDSTDELDDQGGFSLARPTRSFPFRDAMVSTHQPKVGIIEKILNFSGGGLARDKCGVRLQLLSSSSADSDGKCNKDGENNPEPQLKNESSAETDTMDMDSLKEQNTFPGVNSSPKNKDNLLDETEECTFSSFPKKDKKIRFLPRVSMDKPETSTSIAQNLQPLTHLLSKPDPPNPSRLISRPHMIDPGSRWLKRLKLISKSDSFGIGTIREEPPLFRETTKRKNILKMKLDEKGARKDETANEKSNIGQVQGKERERLLSHDWIQRWCRNKAADIKGKIGKEVIREPTKFKLEMEEELRNKQFPSIAAMALMGKTMAGFRTCELKRKGSSVVWNTKRF